MMDRLPAPALHLLERGAAIFVPAPVVPDDVAIAVGDPAQGWNIVGEELELLGSDTLGREVGKQDRRDWSRAPVAVLEIGAERWRCANVPSEAPSDPVSMTTCSQQRASG